ncbi:hypothetical protein [Wolbachia endosymbiont of Brugia pahangi]|uniref:hypothetical protein n=1 Tax=Wolbachia endosymbiont of Brugia pahangi TaxID=96495 RepID=UPI001C551E07|nr:hypothetical protein [Wolbachia endosymbiont of Brugia pahangi]
MILKNTSETQFGTMDRDIMLNLKSSLMKEWMEVSNIDGLYISSCYEIEKVNLPRMKNN